jgi:3-isopropylmalate/(R)-2-methylmalate dehydratase large subunit
VWDNERVVIIPDHYIFTSDPRANRNVDILREMAEKYNIKYFYDIKDRWGRPPPQRKPTSHSSKYTHQFRAPTPACMAQACQL